MRGSVGHTGPPPHPIDEAGAVTSVAHEKALREVVSRSDAIAGPFGPHSMLWTIARESALIFGGLRSVLLQLAHPFVSESLKYVSDQAKNARERFVITMYYCSLLTFGESREVSTAARQVFTIHSRIAGELSHDIGAFRRGRHFQANDPAALWWVAATLWDSSVLAYETFVRPLSTEEKDAYLADCRRWSRLFGIPESMMAPSWSDFERYMADMLASDKLAVSQRAQEAADHIMRPPNKLTAPLYSWMATITAVQMPPSLRDAFGLHFGEREQRTFDRTVRIARPIIRRLPKSLRYNPIYIRATRRVKGLRGANAVSEAILRLLLASLGSPRTASGRAARGY